MKTALYILITMRPKQWAKNGFILMPLFFSRHFTDMTSLQNVAIAFAAFCMLAGAVYLLNDLLDIEKDRKHPTKSKRPLASGKLSPSLAVLAMLFFAAASLTLSFSVNMALGILASLYFANNLAYSFFIKNFVILDVMSIAFGFLLRVLAGAAAIVVPASEWLLMVTILLALFLAFAKRRRELVLLEKQANHHRVVLEHYSPYFLDQMIVIVSAATVMSYALYTISEATVKQFQTTNLIFTVPFVLYGLFRYLYLVHKKDGGGDPTKVLFTDKPIMINLILWLGACLLVIEGIL